MSDALAVKSTEAQALELALLGDDLSRLTSEQRLIFYNRTCESLGLNPLTKPFAYIELNRKLTLYAKRDCTDQLRKIHGVSVTDLQDYTEAGTYIVTAKGRDREGRVDAAKGAVFLGQSTGEMRANLIMKAETKAKRRLTLSLCGLGMLDETEADYIPGAVLKDTDVVHAKPEREKGGTAPRSGHPTTEVVSALEVPPGPGEASHPPQDDLLDDVERERLLNEVNRLQTVKGMKQEARQTAWKTYCGDATPSNVDLAALNDLIKYLQAGPRK